MSKIREVYEKYKHHDPVFMDSDFCGGTYSGAVIHALWKAVRQHVALEDLKKEFGLFPEFDKVRNTQMDVNFKFLLESIDKIHEYLCPDRIVTWQDRAGQAVEAARELSAKMRNQAPKKGDNDGERDTVQG